MRKGLIYIMLIGVMPVFGQNYNYGMSGGGIKPLTKEQGYPPNQLFLQVQEISDSFPLYCYLVYFINSTAEDIIVDSYNGRINPILGAYHKKGKWIFQDGRGWCGTGYGKSIIPANHYAWAYHYQSKGNYETEVKLRLVVNDTVLFSPTFTTFIEEPNRFGKYRYHIKKYEEALRDEIDDNKKVIYLGQIGKMLMSLKKYELALPKFKAITLMKPQNQEARYWIGFLYLKNMANCNVNNKHLRQGILSAALAEWDLIPKGGERYEAVQNRRAAYLPYLLTKTAWETDNNLPFKLTEDGNRLYYIDCLVNDYIKMIYKK